MRFDPQRMLMLPMLLAVMACAGSPPIVASPSACSSLIPDSWRTPVEGAPIPEEAGDALTQLKAWIGFGVRQTGQLDKANGRAADALAIVERCEARDRAAVRHSRRRLLGLF